MELSTKTRILSATRNSKLGAILRCAMDENKPGELPQFIGKACVTSDGFLMCDFIDADGNGHHGAFVGSLADFDANLKGLSDFLELAPAQYNELTAVAAGWVEKDWRHG